MKMLLVLMISALVSMVSAQANLLTNGNFDAGTSGWSGLASGDVATGGFSGNAVHLTSAKSITQGITVTAGHNYVLICRFKLAAFALTGSDWGYWMMEVTNISSVNARGPVWPQSQWNKVAQSFTPTSNSVEIRFGVYGPATTVDLWFDEFQVMEKTSNQLPTCNPAVNNSTGSVPATLQFSANADDPDGAVSVFNWDFGDGTTDNSENPSHLYYTAGTYPVKLTVYDNDNASASKTINVTISDNVNPSVAINSPSDQSAYSTSNTSLTIGGMATGRNAKQITAIVYDNINTGNAGPITITVGTSMNFTSPSISLKPGKNVIWVTATDADGRIATDAITITRIVSGPVVTNIAANSTSVKVFEKYQVNFDLATAADYTFFKYDPNPPQGLSPGTGVTVEGVFTTPSGQTLRHPGFWFRDVTRNGSGHYIEEATEHWAIRFAPKELGTYSVSIYVKDASGEVTTPAGTFTATAPTRKGFIQVAQADSRYFEFTNRELFWPVGPSWAADASSGMNYDRPWMGGTGAYSTNWARWISTAEQHGNEGVGSHFNFREHFPGHELSQYIHYPEGSRMWMGWMDDNFNAVFKSSTKYRVTVRLKVTELAGPRDAGSPYGFVIKVIDGWPSSNFEIDNRSQPSVIPRITQNCDWHTVVSEFTTPANLQGPYIHLYLDNVTAGKVFVDYFSIKEVLTGGTLGGELVRNPSADMHTYVEQRPAAYFDYQLSQGEINNQFYRYVVYDKNDWIPNHLLGVGLFADAGNGYYQEDGTKAKWLLQQWWRYLCARYGYSTSVHSWELNNEGPPDDGTGAHARMTQEFARFMHENDAHRHMASTSFWCCWEPTFWGDKVKFPDVDYGDIHHYSEGSSLMYDMVAWHLTDADSVYKSNIGRPVIRNETGISTSFGPAAELQTPNDGTWFHNLLWSQLHVSGMSDPGYWFQEHFSQINVKNVVKPWADFITRMDLNRGGYVDIAATSSNSSIRILGQKNPVIGKAHLWIQNKTHDWGQVMGIGGQGTVVAQSGTVTINIKPNLACAVQWYNTYTGTVTSTQNLACDGSGNLALTITNLNDDVAVTINDNLQIPVQGQINRLPNQTALSLGQPFPNPFTGLAQLAFSLPVKSKVEFVIFNGGGKRVRTVIDKNMDAGMHGLMWDGKNDQGVQSIAGVYLAQVKVDGKLMVRKMMMMR